MRPDENTVAFWRFSVAFLIEMIQGAFDRLSGLQCTA